MIITPTIKAILLSISGRSKKYGTFWLSRHEYAKYETTPDKLRMIIKKLKQEWYITHEWYEPNPSFRANPVRAIYKATDKLIDLVKSFVQKVVDLNDKIIQWCSEQDPIATLKAHSVELFGYSIGKKRSGITVDRATGCISNWKTGKKWNLFNYLKEIEGQGTMEFYRNFIGNV